MNDPERKAREYCLSLGLHEGVDYVTAWTPASQCLGCGSINHLVPLGRPCPICGAVVVDTTAREAPAALIEGGN